MLTELGVVRVGVEIEIAAYENERTYQDAAKDLLEQGYLLGEFENWKTYHKYGCKCSLGCKNVRSGEVFYPPLVSLTYDASLPINGAEWVTSPVFMLDSGINELKPIWDTVVKDAIWTNKLEDKHGNLCSPSIHLHVSAVNPNPGKVAENWDTMQQLKTVQQDCVHALSLFAPEFIAIASIVDNLRGLQYRQPVRFASHDGHHGFVHVRKFQPDQMVYIEWRMFEAAYESWDYLEQSAFFTSVLTRALLNRNSLNILMAEGYAHPYDEGIVMNATRNDDLPALLRLVDSKRMSMLRNLCLVEAEDDSNAQKIVAKLFDEVEKRYV